MTDFIATTTKDPDDVLDYSLDWTTWLAGDTIASSSWIAETGLTVDSDTNSTTDTTVWVSGGEACRYYTLTNRIVTSAGRTKDRSIQVKVNEQ